jgi:hypothetical protein
MCSRVLVALSLRRGGVRRDACRGRNRFFGGGAARAGHDFARSRPFHSSAGKPMLSRLSRVSTYQRKRWKVGSWQNERYVRPMVGLMSRRRRRFGPVWVGARVSSSKSRDAASGRFTQFIAAGGEAIPAPAGRPAVRWRLGVIAPRPIGAGLAAALCLVVSAGLAEAAPTVGPAFTAGFYHGFFVPGQAYCDSASVTSTTPDPNTSNNTAGTCVGVV